MNVLAVKTNFSRYALAAALLTQLSVAGFSQSQDQARDVYGDVRNKDGKPIAKAIVQLETVDTQAVQTYVSDGDGSFHFKRTSKNADYQIWASLDGHESKKTFISKFNDKEGIAVRLVIDVGR
jgi:hypothetical protein